jgi:TetR/AcrR family transcriptional regulator, transcriptional repressor of aconitase
MEIERSISINRGESGMPKVSEEYSGARRRQIIDAAYRCFAQKGFHEATMRDIYSEANLSPGAVYSYFHSKDEIIQASFEFDFERSQEVFDAAKAGDDPLEAIIGLIGFFFGGLQEAASLGAGRVNVHGWGEALINPALLQTVRRVLDGYLDALTHLIRRAQERGQIDSALDPLSVGRLILSLYYGLELQKALDPEVDMEKYTAAAKALIRSASR